MSRVKVFRVGPGAGHQADPFSIRQRVLSSDMRSRVTSGLEHGVAGEELVPMRVDRIVGCDAATLVIR